MSSTGDRIQKNYSHRTVWCSVFLFSSTSVADPDPGSGAFLTPGSGIRIGFFRISDPGSRIPNPYFWELRDNFLGKKFYNSLKIGPNFFLQHFKNKIVKFCESYDSKKRYDNIFFFTNDLHCCFWIRDPRSGIRDPGSGMGKNQDPGSRINISDPPHCQALFFYLLVHII